MRGPRNLLRDEGAAGAVEFALIAPVFFAMLIGISQLGMLFFANAGIQNALSEGARFATIFPLPSNAEIGAKMTDKRFGVDPANLIGPTIAHSPDEDNDGAPDPDATEATYADITIGYEMPLNFIFFEVEPVTLSHTRRVYTQPAT